MTQQTIDRIHRIYGIVCGAVAVAAGICFLAAAYSLYPIIQIHVLETVAKPAQAYTYESIGAVFSKIAIPVYLCLALVIGGMLLNLIWPRTKKKCPAEKNLPLILSRLQAKTDLEACDADLRGAVSGQQKARSMHRLICIALLALGGALFMSYACNGANWAAMTDTDGIHRSTVKAVFALVLCLLPAAGYAAFTLYFCKRSLSKEIELMRQANAAAPLSSPRPMALQSREQAICITRYAVLVFAVGFIVYGLFAGGTADVLAKAAAICTECVGLG